MATIGTFVPTKDGGWTGHIRTLMIDVKVRLVPNDNKENEAAPAFRVFAGDAEIGAAWRKRSGWLTCCISACCSRTRLSGMRSARGSGRCCARSS